MNEITEKGYFNDKDHRKVLIIHTGGTIGMKNTHRGYMPAPGYLSSALGELGDLYSKSFPSWDLCELDPLLDSSNMSVNEWNKVAEVIHSTYSDYTGFVVLHGTDTMAYTASALSFILRDVGKPVILTGSQIPLSELRSDGRDNLITSVLIAAEAVVKEVCLYFSGKLLRGNRSMKMSSDGLTAFASPNYPPLAEVGITVKYNHGALLPTPSAPLSFTPFKNIPIGVLKVFPGIQFGLFEDIMTEKLSGIVLETFGAGNIPAYGNDLLPIIKKAFSAGAVVTVISQCPAGTVTLGAYEASASLKGSGAVSGKDMTTEAAVAKLYYLFSLVKDRDEIKRLMETDLAGELSE